MDCLCVQIKSVETHTKALGIISPPPDLRAIIDKSAAFVAKNGEWSTFSGLLRQMHAQGIMHVADRVRAFLGGCLISCAMQEQGCCLLLHWELVTSMKR